MGIGDWGPDISKWKTSNVKYFYFVFNTCDLLKSLPDISKWKTNNLENMRLHV